MPIDYASFGYAAAVAGGGVMGYVKSKSIPSLAAGLLFGTLLGYGAYQTSSNPRNSALLLGTSATLGGMMGYRYYTSGKLMPAGAIATLSILMFTRTLMRHFTAATPIKIE